MALDIDRSTLGREFDRVTLGPITADELITFAKALGETAPEYTQPGPDLIAHPTFCSPHRGRKFYPEGLPIGLDLRTGFDAGKDVELGEPMRPGDTITVSSTLHDIYEKTGRSGSMAFVVIRFTLTNQHGQMIATVDNRFMHRGPR